MASYDKISEIVYEKIMAWRLRVKILQVHSYYTASSRGPILSYILADEDGKRIEFNVFGESVYKLAHVEALEDKWVEIFGVRVGLAGVGFRATNSEFKLTPGHYTRVRPIDPINDRHFMEFREIREIPQIRNKNFPIDVMGVVFNVEACFDDQSAAKVVFYIRDDTENEIKCIATGNCAYRFRDELEIARGHEEVIVVLKMWRIHRYIVFRSGPYVFPKLIGANYFDDDRWLQNEGGLSDFSFDPRLPEVGKFRQSLLRRQSLHGVTRP